MKFEYSTPQQNLLALRKRFRDAKGIEAAKIARWNISNLTPAQIKDLFDLTNAQVSALRGKWIAIKVKLEEIEAVQGE